MKTSIITVASLFMAATCALADCPIDTAGLSGRNAFDGNLPKDHINADGARTLDDFVDATANELFFTEKGAEYIWLSAGQIYFFRGYAPSSSSTDIPDLYFHGPACNEIGQCVDTTTTLRAAGTSSSVLNWFSDFLSDGLVTDLNANLMATSYSIQATDSKGKSSPVRDFLPESILNQQLLGQQYALSTDSGENIDTRCRNNKGKLVGGNAGSSSGTIDFDFGTPDISPPAYWTCWATPTGVACRRH